MDHSAAEYVAAARHALAQAEETAEAMKANNAAAAAAPVFAAVGQGWALLAVAAAVQETGGDLGDAVDAITPPA